MKYSQCLVIILNNLLSDFHLIPFTNTWATTPARAPAWESAFRFSKA